MKMPYYTGLFYLHKPLPLLQIKQTYHHPDNTACQEEDTILQDQAFPYDGEEVVGHLEWVEQDVPEGTLDEIHLAGYQEKDGQDDRNHRRSVAAAGDGREHKCHIAEEDQRKHQLDSHLERIDRIKQQGSQIGKNH